MKTVSVSETRQQLSAFLNWIKQNRQDVIIQNRGRAEVVMIPYEDYDLLQAARERRRRQEAVAELQEIAQTVQAANAQLPEEEAEALADEVVREAVENLQKQGKVQFGE
ncbi:MAG: type II toxin-antitoxin system Phd/YefM family antitoxin [Anaerolineae bacterium]